jgi:hypothetical protein
MLLDDERTMRSETEPVPLKQKGFLGMNKGLQNLYSSVRLRSAPPKFFPLSSLIV